MKMIKDESKRHNKNKKIEVCFFNQNSFVIGDARRNNLIIKSTKNISISRDSFYLELIRINLN